MCATASNRRDAGARGLNVPHRIIFAKAYPFEILDHSFFLKDILMGR